MMAGNTHSQTIVLPILTRFNGPRAVDPCVTRRAVAMGVMVGLVDIMEVAILVFVVRKVGLLALDTRRSVLADHASTGSTTKVIGR